MEDFSVCIIARNGEYGLARLLRSLAGVSDIVLLDTGSTDGTVGIAESFGCRVVEVGDQFRQAATEKQVKRWRQRFPWEPSFQAGGRYFHFADARNYAAACARNDWVFCPDVDEEMRWDLAKVREAIQGEDHLVYRFIYAHKPDGSPAIEFTQSKFFRRSKFHWAGHVHEVEQPLPGCTPKLPRYCEFITHHHWQDQGTPRSNYLPGLELAVLKGELPDRNIFYLGREYMYRQEWDRAITLFRQAMEIQAWKEERGEAYHFMGNCHRAKGERDKAVECYHKSFAECDGRREPFFALASLYDDEGQAERAIVYYQAAMAIPYKSHGYLTSNEMYGSLIPDRLAFAYARMGNNAEAKKWWLESLKGDPDNRILGNAPFFYGPLPLVSIVVPVVREGGFQRLAASIRADASYPNYEIVKVEGGETAIEKFNTGVEQAKGKFVAFLADDTEVRPGWLVKAYACWREHFERAGLVILNDDYWHGKVANHFLCSKNVRDELGGEIWHHGYGHYSADTELYQRLKQRQMVAFCPEAQIIHHHPWVGTPGATPAPLDEHYRRICGSLAEDRKLLYRRQKELGFGPKVAVFCTTHNNEAIIGEFVTENLKYVQEVYISDNMSTDRTMEVAQAAGAKVRQSGILHSPEHYDEGETKQKAMEFALEESECEWLLYLDSDEILEERAVEMLPELVNNLQYDAWGMRVPTFWLGRTHYRIDGDFALYVQHPYQMRLFRRGIGVRMTVPPKGGHSFPAMNGDPSKPWPWNYKPCDLMLKHYGYPDREAALRKWEMYNRADPEGVMSRNVPHYAHLHPDYPGVQLVPWGHPYPILESLFGKGDLVFDIGANVGQSVKVFKELGAKVVAVEPNPAAACQVENDVVLWKACSDIPGTIKLRLPNQEGEATMSVLATIVQARADCDYYKPVFSEGREIEVEAVTLDMLIAEHGEPAFVKIDVEGAEVAVLRGLSVPVKALSFEILGMQPDWEQCFAEVGRLGDYEYTMTGGEEWTPLLPWGDAESVKSYFKEHAGFRDYFNVYCRRKGG